ncbi:MAG: hypothetical protein M1817_004744 [Caeruleum heppii]|nr:MAG: hypothetical protein M1817_004744 [Caeruleum heppii]
MQMSSPFPIRSPLDSATTGQKDYDYTSPLNADGSNYPCKGYHTDTPLRSAATYSAGGSYSMSISGGAPHNGGSCQLSLSYDNGKTFKVIKSMMGGCPLTTSYNFKIPAFAPSGTAIFAWTWFNIVGNREMYMNCAAVTINGASTKRSRVRRQTQATSLDSLPNIYTANIGSKSECTTIEGQEVVFPEPGPDVVYGGGVSSSSPPAPGKCSGRTPVSSGPSSPNSPSSAASLGASSAGSSAPVASNPVASTRTSTLSSAFGTPPAGTSSSRPTATPNASTPPISPNPSNTGGVFVPMDPEPTDAGISPTPSQVPSTPNSLPPSPSQTPSTQPTTPPDTSSSTTCQPQTLRCDTFTSFSACNGQGTGFIPMGPVAAGTECIDGEIVRARAPTDPSMPADDGRCSADGTLRCVDAGRGFQICDHGGWVAMGAVARGTVCRDGNIVAE